MNKIHWVLPLSKKLDTYGNVVVQGKMACGREARLFNATCVYTPDPTKVTCQACKKSNTFKEMTK